MLDKIKELAEEIHSADVRNQEELECFRIRYISRKSIIGDLFMKLKNVAPEDRRSVGQALNELKDAAQSKFKNLIQKLESDSSSGTIDHIDLTLPPVVSIGSRHPLSITRARIFEIFQRIGFNLSDGPEIETDWYNFSALNFPEDHPAREMQDTFFLYKSKSSDKTDPDIALRTHTSSVQVRVMEKQMPPIRSLMPGRVFRNEAISARAHCIFHQVEGLYINENVSFADLKQTLYHFAKEFFGKDTTIRFRPSFFPFTEPSAEIDISCQICKGKGCNICKYTGWVEIGGAGMVDPNVLLNCKIDPEKYTGFAFGMGIERMAMLKYQIKDLRYFTENDIRFLSQFIPEN
ncbi:phenylalanine--tRNA ligase subunit alpha [soil metagenome]